MKVRIIPLVGIFVAAFTLNAFAAINVTKQTAEVKIYMPDGTQVVVTKDQPMPSVIPDGSAITILAGSCVVSTTGKSTVVISIGTYTVELKEASKINLTLNPDGTVQSTILAGQANISRKVEPYTAPPPPNAGLNTDVTNDGIQKDISPSS
jgi:hypothetical protein